ncbi:hypothetical protein [Neisseria elongata]|uniref:hypothetical protein n=1 Tax=Neisseria elongata TaxID=495 RepID=UPI003609CAE7
MQTAPTLVFTYCPVSDGLRPESVSLKPHDTGKLNLIHLPLRRLPHYQYFRLPKPHAPPENRKG